VGGNPVSLIDPTGEFGVVAGVAVGVAIWVGSEVMWPNNPSDPDAIVASSFPDFTAIGSVAGKLAGKFCSSTAKGGQAIIGEGMKRVGVEAAKRPGSVILNNMPKFTGTANQVTSQMMTYNRQWILQQMRSGRPILDIGLDATRANPSMFYQMEQNMMRNYLKLHPNAFQIIK
jgi:hypothetical protein